MSNDKDFKVKNGVKPTAYYEGLGTVVSGSVGYGLGGAVYDGVSFSVAAQDSSPLGLFFKPDGLKMYVLGNIADAVIEYNLSTAWDISSATFLQTFSVAAQETVPQGLFFKPDGLKMYVVGSGGDDVNEYDLSAAWDISSATFLQNFSVAAQDTRPTGLFFKPDGTKMYVVGEIVNDIIEYDLSTAWDISSASFLQNFSVAAQGTDPNGVFFKPDGLKMYVLDNAGGAINEYNLSTAWDVSSATFLQNFSVSAQDIVPRAVFFKPDGAKMFIAGDITDAIYQYSTLLTTNTLDLSTGSVFEITPTSNIGVTLSNPADSGTVSGATLLLEAVGTAYTITYDTAIQWPSGTAPTAPAIGDTDVITFTTRDGGTTYNASLAIDGAS